MNIDLLFAFAFVVLFTVIIDKATVIICFICIVFCLCETFEFIYVIFLFITKNLTVYVCSLNRPDLFISLLIQTVLGIANLEVLFLRISLPYDVK